MREIKFRAWNRETRQMVDLQAITPLALSIQPELVGARTGVYVPDDDRLVIMQFTGLKDKSGREIYEGDVVKSGNNDQIMTVKFYQSGFYLFWPDGGVSVPLWPFIVGNEIEVIGNVWEKGQADGD